MHTIPRVMILTAALAMTLTTSRADAAPNDVNRNVEPVVVTGAEVPAWSGPAASIVCMPYPSGALTGERDAHNGTFITPPATGVPVGEIAAYRWGGSAFVEIPVQVDQVYPYCLSNPNSDFGIYSGTDKEYTFQWDVESWKKISGECTAEYFPGEGPLPDPVGTLDADDEIVFMASDAGPQAPVGAPEPAGATDSLALVLTDPLNPANVSFVYLFRKPGGSSFTAANGYVSYVRDANADQWIDRLSFLAEDPEKLGSSNTGYGPNLEGTVCDPPNNTPRPSSDRFPRDGITVSTDAYRFYASGRWMTRSVQVAKPGQPGVYGPDLIDRWKGRAFQQSPDSTISLVGFEDEQVNWEANAATLGERMGPVRAIREVWGADSGTNVTKIEHFYRDAIATRYHVRVHPIPPDGLYSSWDYNAGVASTYYNTVKSAGVPIDGINDDTGNVDGVEGFPAFFDAPDPTFNAPTALLNWEQVSGANDYGSLVYIIELKGATTVVNPAVVPYYRDDKCLDDGTGDDPVQRPWPGEATTDARVKNGYCAAAGGNTTCAPGEYEALTCDQKQGAWASHGVHYFFSQDSDNAASPETLTEIDSQWWQFTVPTSAPTNVGDAHGNVVKFPLQTAALPIGGLGFAPPAASDASATTPQDTAVDVTLTGLDVDTCELTFSIVDPPDNGGLALANLACTSGLPNSDTATATYTPTTGFAGTDTFTYKVNDGTMDSNTATVTIMVQAAPTVTPTPTITPTPTATLTATATAATPTPTPTSTPAMPSLCGPEPATSCRIPAVPRKSLLQLKDKPNPNADRLLWKWARGESTSKANFGTPHTTTSYEFCIYDGDGTLISRGVAPADDICVSEGTRPCWREKANGFQYVDRAGTPDGIQRLQLKAGTTGKAQIILKGKGGNLQLPTMPVAMLPITVQLKNSNGECWEARYSTTYRNQPDQLKAKSD